MGRKKKEYRNDHPRRHWSPDKTGNIAAEMARQHDQTIVPTPIPVVAEVREPDHSDDDAALLQPNNLTPKQERFCQAYIGSANFNATKAAQIAGYRDDNIFSLREVASQNLAKPFIQRRIAALLAQTRDGEFAHNRCRELAGTSMADFLQINPQTGEPVPDLRKAQMAGALGSIKRFKCKTIPAGKDEEGNPQVVVTEWSIELFDPQPSIALLLRMAGKFIEPSDPQSAPVVVKRVVAGLLDRLPPPKDEPK